MGDPEWPLDLFEVFVVVVVPTLGGGEDDGVNDE